MRACPHIGGTSAITASVDDAQQLEEVNARFYDAFAKQDLAAMDAVWAREVAVACIHPGWPALENRGDVMASWRAILGDLPGGDAPEVACAEPRVTVVGDMGFVICKELVGPHELLATNVFVREGGQWRIVHHHAAPVYADEAPLEDAPSGSLN